jgi:hypothetical protein
MPLHICIGHLRMAIEKWPDSQFFVICRWKCWEITLVIKRSLWGKFARVQDGLNGSVIYTQCPFFLLLQLCSLGVLTLKNRFVVWWLQIIQVNLAPSSFFFRLLDFEIYIKISNWTYKMLNFQKVPTQTNRFVLKLFENSTFYRLNLNSIFMRISTSNHPQDRYIERMGVVISNFSWKNTFVINESKKCQYIIFLKNRASKPWIRVIILMF